MITDSLDGLLARREAEKKECVSIDSDLKEDSQRGEFRERKSSRINEEREKSSPRPWPPGSAGSTGPSERQRVGLQQRHQLSVAPSIAGLPTAPGVRRQQGRMPRHATHQGLWRSDFLLGNMGKHWKTWENVGKHGRTTTWRDRLSGLA